ncbi:hypothetical protein LTR86_008155 [Recurvomyces mirabilis]|nr:hypothetical protein LTR86_008155 [Recurvomyces mirabilis]
MEDAMKPVSGIETLDHLSTNKEELAVFPKPARNEIQHAMATVIHSANIGASSPLGILRHRLAVKFYPELRRCVKVKDDLMTEKLAAARKKFNRHNASEDDVKSATDLFVAREVSQAARQNRTPVYDSPEVRDELFTFLLAGWETTATVLKWAVKHLTAQQEVQQKLRQCLRAFYKDAAARGEVPSHKELVHSQPAYLNAVLEEILRHATVAAATIRTTTQDVEVLGYHIPKGTDVWLPNRGKGMLAPSFPIEESKRSKTSQFVKPGERWTAEWDDDTLDQFLPERWLRPNEHGGMDFDAQSGPMQTFGAGLRGCFGQKLAMMSLRMLVTYIVWSFELLPVPEEFAGFEAEDRLTWEPQQVHLRLRRCDV